MTDTSKQLQKDTSKKGETEGANSYVIRPETQNRFRPSKAKEMILDILKNQLTGVKYDYSLAPGNDDPQLMLLIRSFEEPR